MLDDPVLQLFVVCVTLQAIVWRWLYDADALFLRSLNAWLRRHPKQEEAMLANARPQWTVFGITEPAVLVKLWLPASASVPLHHGAAVSTAFMSYYYGSATLLRVALSFEIGENVLHYAQVCGPILGHPQPPPHALGRSSSPHLCAPCLPRLQMAWTWLKPAQGISPWQYLDGKAWGFILLHHTLGFVAGSAAFLSPINVCAWPELQLFVAMVLFAGMPSYLKVPLQLCDDLARPSVVGCAAAAIDVVGLLVMSWVRLGWGQTCYFTMARELVGRCRGHGDCSATFYAVPLLYVFPLFNVMSVLIHGPYVYARVREQLATLPRPATAEKQR